MYSVEPQSMNEYVFHRSEGMKMSVHFVMNNTTCSTMAMIRKAMKIFVEYATRAQACQPTSRTGRFTPVLLTILSTMPLMVGI